MSGTASERIGKPAAKQTPPKGRPPELSAAGVGASPVQAVTQLQRMHGNRRTLQMVRGAPPVRPAPRPALAGKKVVQLDRLVEMQTGKDKDDFDAVRGQVQASTGVESSGNWLGARFDVNADEVVYVWGHMDETAVGGVEYWELAEIMVERGFTGCAAVRLIGCNNPESPGIAPKALWDALTAEFTKQREEAAEAAPDEPAPAIVMPTIYATKGPLQSSADEGFAEGWWVGVSSEKEKKFLRDLAYIMNYARTKENPENYNVVWLDGQVDHYEDNLDDEQTLATLDGEEKEAFIEKESAAARSTWRDTGKVDYPTLQTEVEGPDGQTQMVWNPDAWVSYAGAG